METKKVDKKEYNREYMRKYIKNADNIFCEYCGKTYKSYRKYKHEKTKLHIDNVNKGEHKEASGYIPMKDLMQMKLMYQQVQEFLKSQSK